MPDAIPLVKAEIPELPDNKFAQIVLEGMRTGMAAGVQLSQQRRQTESDIARLALQEKQNQAENDLRLKKLNMDAEMLPLQKELAQAHADYYKNYATTRTNALTRDYRFNQQEEEMVNDVNNQARKLQLLDPALPTRNPVAYAESALAFRDMYSHSDKPWLRNAVRSVMSKAEAQKLTIHRAFRDSAGNWTAGKEPLQVPFYQVVLKLKNPDTKEEAMKELEFGGHIGTKTEMVNKPATGWFANLVKKGSLGALSLPDVEEEKKTPYETPEATMLKKGAEDYSFTPQKSRVPAAQLPKNAHGGTSPTPLNAGQPVNLPFEQMGEPPADREDQSLYPDQSNAAPADDGGYVPTESDQLLSQAIRALRAGAAPKLVAARLQEKGVDPSQLFGEGGGTMMA